MAQEKTYKLKVTLVIEVKSDEYDNPETMMNEIAQEANYDVESTDCVEVVGTEFRDIQLI
jgi:hypothetical protein